MCKGSRTNFPRRESNEIDPACISVDSGDSKCVTKTNNNDVEKKGFFNSLSSQQQLCILTVAMFTFFGIHNILQEAIMKIPDFKYGVMLGYMEVLGVTVCSFLERKYIRQEVGRKAPLKAYPLLTMCLMSSSALSNMSLNYINFPTKVVFRSCKLLPTMMFATFINRRVFSSTEYSSALAVCVGLILFTAADWRLTPSFNPIGLAFVFMSVIADAVLPNAQEHLFSHGSSRLEVTVYTNFFTLIAMTCSTLASGDMVGIIKQAMSNQQLALYMAVYIAISYVAISSFMMIVKRYGAVTGVLLSTARKGMTLILSFILFPKQFSWCYVFGAVLVLGGLLISSLYKQKLKRKKQQPESGNQEGTIAYENKINEAVDVEMQDGILEKKRIDLDKGATKSSSENESPISLSQEAKSESR